jgi:tol-pal system protein YbgF
MSPAARLVLAPLSIGLAILALAGCASQDDLSEIRREQRQMARRIADTRADVDSLRQAVNRLQGRVDDLGGTSSHSATPPPDIEQRLRALEQGSSTREPAGGLLPGEPPPQTESTVVSSSPPPSTVASAPPPSAPVPVNTTAPPSAAAQGGSDETPRDVDIQKDLSRGGSDQYREGLQSYQKGDYPRAVQSLRGFVNKDSKSELVPSAQYWIGESYYAQKRYNESILAYNEILVGWPKSDRVPAALLRQASAFAELGDKIDARLILQKLISDHPGTEEAAIAKRKLLTLGS